MAVCKFSHSRLVLKELKVLKTKTDEFTNSVDFDKAVHSEPPHLDLNWLPSNLCIIDIFFFQFCRRIFCHLHFGA